MELDGVHHIGVNVNNLDRALDFYCGILGFEVIERYEESIRHVMLNSGSTGIHLFEVKDLKMNHAFDILSGEGYAHIAFGTTVDKFPEIIEEMKSNKVVFEGPKLLGKGRSIHFQDPDGNHLEIRCPAY